MKLLKQYYNIIHKIYEYFDCDIDTNRNLIIDDFTEFYYRIDNDKIYYSSDSSKEPNEFNDQFINSYDGDEFIMFHIKNEFDESLCVFDKSKFIDEIDDYVKLK